MSAGHTLGVLRATNNEVPGTVLLLSGNRVEPLGLERKRTPDGIILVPQPDDNPNDPLNWPSWRRNCALLSLGWHCLVGGGQTPVLAAGFKDVAKTFNVTLPQVALTTGLYMLGLGVGCIVSSPTALIFGKRPVYLAGIVLFLASSLWAAASQSYVSLLVARILMGIGVAPCESLPSATIAEIFFLHERAYRIGIYTLLLLGGKNLVPLVSAVIIQAKGWRWVFWVVSIVVGFNLGLLFLFVPETFWDRTPRPKKRASDDNVSFLRRASSSMFTGRPPNTVTAAHATKPEEEAKDSGRAEADHPRSMPSATPVAAEAQKADSNSPDRVVEPSEQSDEKARTPDVVKTETEKETEALGVYPPHAAHLSRKSLDGRLPVAGTNWIGTSADMRVTEPASFGSSLKLYNGRQQRVGWFRAAFRPFVLFAYPAVLWSTVVYSLSVGWLIVLSESVAEVYQHQPYNFSRLGTGLVYISPFIGGIIGTAVAGKISDLMVRFMCRRNGGVYEPEFRLVMGIPVALSTAIGLMGFGWSAEEQNSWIVPTMFFGIISFGCSLGSTTAITFCVDSYRQYAGEALVTLNFSKNVLHGFVFSLFFNHWLEADGSRTVFVALGAIQMGCLLFTIPLYMYGKRLRLWTLEKNMMGRFE